LHECGWNELDASINRVALNRNVNQFVLETPRQAEQDRDDSHDPDDHPRSRRSATGVNLERMTDGYVAIDGQQNNEPVIDQTDAVHHRIEDDEDTAVNILVSGPADVAE